MCFQKKLKTTTVLSGSLLFFWFSWYSFLHGFCFWNSLVFVSSYFEIFFSGLWDFHEKSSLKHINMRFSFDHADAKYAMLKMIWYKHMVPKIKRFE